MKATAWFCCIALFAPQGQAAAQTEFPSRPLRYVVLLPPPAEAADAIRREVAKWTKLVKDSGLNLDQ